jgi:hypothetical protein
MREIVTIKTRILTGGCCSEVIYVLKVLNGISKWWSLKTGGRCSEVVVSLGLTILTNATISTGQRIQLRFLDISLREGLSSRDPECSDSVRVSERGKTLLHMCGESIDDIVLLSQRSKLEVRGHP